ncbi:transporter substrate-binding domain-containing protein [Fulvivirga sp. 29W222]|uniref:Transporter substrate-binding domain-containing protein n=1 Tax=Fulvivirga marina TaxID=2494733 RepID=A0A937KCI4_9BACT|nr:transporter substrate-binding domain-containing protein [Fulvivirga marina]MBL6447557.1 transporter substrate-binding domain-containing protein [Fulvivirga marina]
MNRFVNKRKIQFVLVFTLMLSTSYLFGQLKGDTYAVAKSKGSANWVFTYAESPGFASKKNGKMTGITVDLMKKFEEYVEKKEGIEVSVTYQGKNPNNFTLFLDEVKKGHGGVFGLSNTTITDARKRAYSFSPPYITNIGMVLTHSSVPTLNNISDIAQKFAGMTAVTIKNSTNEKWIMDIKSKYYPALKVEYVASFGKAMGAIIADPKKFTNVDFTYYFEAIQNRQPVKRHPGGDETTEQFGIIMPKNNDWAPLLRQFMSDEFITSVEYKKIIADNLGQSAMKFFETLKK